MLAALTPSNSSCSNCSGDSADTFKCDQQVNQSAPTKIPPGEQVTYRQIIEELQVILTSMFETVEGSNINLQCGKGIGRCNLGNGLLFSRERLCCT